MTVRGSPLRIARIELMHPFGIVVSSLAGLLRGKTRVWLGQVVNLVHEIAFT
jgi:hypothetical protein